MKSLLLLFFFIVCTVQMFGQDTLDYTVKELIYGRKDGMALTMIRLSPKEKANKKAIISVVSGNWVSSYDQNRRFISSAEVFLNKGYTVFLVMHGSQPRYTIIDATTDLKRAVRYIRYNAKEHNINPLQIGIMGSSSGGNLSLLAGLSDDKIDSTSKDQIDRVSGRVQAIAVFYPPVDFLNWGKEQSNPVIQNRGILTLAGVIGAFEFKEWNDTTRTYKLITDQEKLIDMTRKISPVYLVSSDDPPVLVIHGDADRVVPLQQSTIFIDKLNAAKVTNELIVKKGAGHGWNNMKEEQEKFAAWFDKYLK